MVGNPSWGRWADLVGGELFVVGHGGLRWVELMQRQPVPMASHTRPWSKAQIQSVRWLSGHGHGHPLAG